MTSPITIAFAGHGDVDKDNARALLNDLVGLGDEDKEGYPAPSEREIFVIIPVTKEHLSDGLDVILDWLEYADLPFTAVSDKAAKSRAVDKVTKEAEKIDLATNVTARTIDLLREAEADGDSYLILAYDEESDADELLLDAAMTAGIPAKDLTAGLDDLKFSAEAEPTPDPEPEPPRRGRRGGRRTEEEATPEEVPLTEDAVKEAPKTPARRSRTATKPVAEAAPTEESTRASVPAAEMDLILVVNALDSAYRAFQMEDARNALISQADVRERPLTELLRKALNTLEPFIKSTTEAAYGELADQQTAEKSTEDEESSEAPRERRGRPRDEEKTFAFLEAADGTFTRRGRGRVPKGSTIVELTRAEIAEMGLTLAAE